MKTEREANPTDLARAILARLVAIEKRLDKMDAAVRREFDEHMTMIAENQAHLMPDGSVRLVAMEHESECLDQFQVLLKPAGPATVI